MTGSRVLLDTNIVAAYFNQEQAIRVRLAGATVYLPSIVLGELFFGAMKSQRKQANLTRIRDFIPLVTVLNCVAATAERYGTVKAKLHDKGRPIPENDIWIAALALQHQLTLVTRDEHFKVVDSLALDSW